MNKHFKKIACVAALSLMPMVAFADEGNASGIFLGFDTGYTFEFDKLQVKNTTEVSTASSLSGANVGVKAGYNFYFTEMLGVRGYLDYTFVFKPAGSSTTNGSASTSSSSMQATHLITFNADLLINFMQTDSITFGAFAGIGLGYGMFDATSTSTSGVKTVEAKASGFILPINIGLNLTANNHHRFELGFKIPTLGISLTHSTNGVAIPANTFETNSIRLFTTSIGYSYIF